MDELSSIETKVPVEFTKSKHGKIQDHKCLICNCMQCAGSMSSHLLQQHGESKIYGETYVALDQFGDVIPKNSKKAKRATKTPAAKCLLCDWQGSMKGISYHLKSHHNQGQKQGENYEILGQENITSVKPAKKKASSDPTFMELRIPVTLVIPLVCGNVRIEQ
jgi:hypothetical protein